VESVDISAIRQLIAMKALTSFRLLQCFDYSVNLFFHEDELTYYVTLHQDTAVSRALKTIDLASAESAFHTFEKQVTRLAASVARGVQLEADNRRLARLVAQSEAEFERLRENLREESEQARSMTARHRQVRKNVSQLEVQRVATQAYLGRMGREIQRLTLISNERLPRLSS
jgi:predicted RNase H-like nuclease (RuvC/YqgF family)